ncbi:hypothetical protein AURDEDRAFT_167619 [Auricularia subglabra TFB-10046 SS5]|nr:hypothetical protein AURDEDRAFT_167619 [Auricularia subglabra TFB-10046 SS5]
MADIDILGPTIREALAESVRRFFDSAFLRNGSPKTLSAGANVRSAIEAVVKTTLASEIRCLNARLSLQNRLPNELWCNVWELLSDVDRVSVTRVCSHWRALCHGFPRLSTDLLFYTTYHSHWCRCPECTGSIEEKDHNPSGWEINPYPKTSTNVASAVDAVSRSRSLPLRIAFDVVPFVPDPDVLNSLYLALLPHVGRLAILRLRVCDPDDAANFLSHFAALPALRVLDLDVVADNRKDAPTLNWAWFITDKIALPVLEELHVRSAQYVWHSPAATVHYPTLRTLTMSARSFRDMVRILRRCPNLRTLRLHLSSDTPVSVMRTQEVLWALIGSMPLTDVQISGITTQDAVDYLLPAFKPLSLQHFALGIEDWYPSEILWRFLDQLGSDIHVSYTRTPTGRDVRGTDCDGRTRRIWKTLRRADPRDQLMSSSLWLPWRRTVSLSMDAKEWTALISRGLPWPRLETLSIVFSENTDIGTVSHNPASDGNEFSVLRFVTVAILADDVQVTAENVAAALRPLRLATPLERLSLDKRIQGYDEKLFATFAKDICLD